MVLTILVYNMMGASQVLPIYLFVKTLYSALLFLHGWNQFLSYLQRGDFGLVKCLQDLFRLNVMAILLCVSMNRPYQFYEFVTTQSFIHHNSTFHSVKLWPQTNPSFSFLGPVDFVLDGRSLHFSQPSSKDNMGHLWSKFTQLFIPRFQNYWNHQFHYNSLHFRGTLGI